MSGGEQHVLGQKKWWRRRSDMGRLGKEEQDQRIAVEFIQTGGPRRGAIVTDRRQDARRGTVGLGRYLTLVSLPPPGSMVMFPGLRSYSRRHARL